MNILDNTTEPDELEQILQSYKGDSQAVDEDAVLRQYPEKLNQAHDDNLQEAKQAIQAHIDEKVNEVLELIGKPEEPWKFDHYPGDYRIGYSRAIRDFEDKLRQSASRRYGE